MTMPVIVSSDTSREQAISDVIESVALIETGLAHIVNAEGEKLQKGINLSDVTNDDLLDINKSVEKMIKSITKLEFILESKLDLFEKCICKE